MAIVQLEDLDIGNAELLDMENLLIPFVEGSPFVNFFSSEPYYSGWLLLTSSQSDAYICMVDNESGEIELGREININFKSELIFEEVLGWI